MQDIEIFFNDRTINESECSRTVVEKLMQENIRVKEWMIESQVALTNGLEESVGLMQFWNNGEAILKDFQSGFIDEIVPVDAIFLCEHLEENGWDFVVSEDQINENREFWDRFFSILEADEDVDYGDDDFYGDDENFIEHSEYTKEYKKPIANKYNILSLDEFKDHGYDLEKRNKDEEENKF